MGSENSGNRFVVQILLSPDQIHIISYADAFVGKIVDRTSPIFNNTQRPGQPEEPVSVQVR
jgi:hypothetical protein